MPREIVRWPDPVLSAVCDPVTDFAAADILAGEMLAAMYAARGRGLAAPQVGERLRLFVMDAGWKDGAAEPLVFVNPEIVAASEAVLSGPEGCLSIPGVMAEVARNAWVEVTWQDVTGAPQSARFDGFKSVCAQHEIDHLNGIVTFDRVGPDLRAELEATYGA